MSSGAGPLGAPPEGLSSFGLLQPSVSRPFQAWPFNPGLFRRRVCQQKGLRAKAPRTKVLWAAGFQLGPGSEGGAVTRANRPSDSGWPSTRRIVKGREPAISAAMSTADSLIQRS